MTNCYRCGKPIDDTRYKVRRKVRTGEHERWRTRSRKAIEVQTHYGYRIVCTKCAHALARASWIALTRELILIGGWLTGLAIILLLVK